MTDKQLIDAVRKRPCLYNNKMKNYRNFVIKIQTWAEVGRELQLSEVECKKKWNRLRGAYLHAMLRRFRGLHRKKYRKWKLEEEMSFLEPFMEFGKWANREFSKRESLESTQEMIDDPEWDDKQDQAATEDTNTSNEMPSSSQAYQDDRKASEDDDDDLNLFFQYLTKTIKKLPSIEQIQLKTDIIYLVSQAEMRALQLLSSESKDPGGMKTESVTSTRHQIKIEIDPKSSEPGSSGESTDFDDPLT